MAEALSNGDGTVRQRAAQVLGDIPAAGALAIHALVKALSDDDEFVRLTILNTLDNIGSAAAPATPALVRILADSDDIIERGIVASVLSSIGPPAEEAVPQLLKCLQEPGESAARVYFRLKVADALWRISGVAEHLLAMGSNAITSPEWWLRWQGARCLGELGAAGSVTIPQLRRLVEDEHLLVRRSAAESVGKIEAVA